MIFLVTLTGWDHSDDKWNERGFLDFCILHVLYVKIFQFLQLNSDMLIYI